MADGTKSFKMVLNGLKKAAEGDSPEKLSKAVGDLLVTLPGKKPPKGAAAAPGAGKAPAQEEIEEVKEALDEFASNYEETDEDMAVQKGLFGGGTNWKIIVPILVDLAKKFLEGLLARQEQADADAE